MSILIYKEQEYPFSAEFDYVTKDKDGKDVKHTLAVKLTESQLSVFDVTDKSVADAMDAQDPDTIAKTIMTPAQIKELKANTNNAYQYNSILTNIASHIMGFINAQRVEAGVSAMNSSPAMKRYGKYIKR
jgi:hypothetical protein